MTITKKVAAPDIGPVLSAIDSLESEEGVPRSVKVKMAQIRELLQKDDPNMELSVKLSRIFSDLDEMSEDVNIPSFIKTHIWNLSGLLERLNKQ